MEEDVAKLAGEAAATREEMAVAYHAGTDTGAERQHDEVAAASRRAVGHLTYGRRIGVVGYHGGDAGSLLHKIHKRYGRRPGEVGCPLYHAGGGIGTWSTDAYALHLPSGAVGLHESGNLRPERLDI